jgi:hypothetical protein
MTGLLPGVLAEIAVVAGEPAAALMAARVGGQRVYIPAKARDDHWLVECVGREKADLICRHFTVDGRGQRIDIPLAGGGAYGPLRRAIARRVHDLDMRGESARDIAAETGITTRSVHRHRAAHRGGKDKRQESLF